MMFTNNNDFSTLLLQSSCCCQSNYTSANHRNTCCRHFFFNFFLRANGGRRRLSLIIRVDRVIGLILVSMRQKLFLLISFNIILRPFALGLVPLKDQFRVKNLGKRRDAVIMMGRRAAKNAARKGKSDMAKAKLYARAGKKIVMAVKAGGPDQIANTQLAQIIRDAKSAGVPVANIERAVKAGSATETADFKESTFEAYGHGGAGLIVNVLTDNANRASADVQSTIRKRGLKLASPGSVLFNFERKGKITVKADTIDDDKLLEIAVEAEVDDYCSEPGDEDGTTTILTDLPGLSNMQDALSDAGFQVLDANLAYVPLTTVSSITDDDIQSNFAAIYALEALDDVDSVDHNMDLDDEE
mmetsp:Transcript_16409/g.24638  ORF Transcript_16409/g.24638 Transcript_16409/m.24638 type:complete len:357 (+) Transcript_16409:1160-2230(+)